MDVDCDSKRKPEYINKRVELVFEDAADSNGELIAEHVKRGLVGYRNYANNRL